MTISVISKRRLRGFVRSRGADGHAAPERTECQERSAHIPLPRGAESARAYQGLHKASASAPRLSGPYEKLSGPQERVA